MCRCRITGRSALDGRLQCTLKSSVVEQEFFLHSDLTLGAKLSATVIRILDAYGAAMTASEMIDLVITRETTFDHWLYFIRSNWVLQRGGHSRGGFPNSYGPCTRHAPGGCQDPHAGSTSRRQVLVAENLSFRFRRSSNSVKKSRLVCCPWMCTGNERC